MKLFETREQLETALSDVGLRVVPQGQASPPSVFIIPGSPWIEPTVLGSQMRQVNWSIMCVVSAANEKAAIRDQELWAQAIISACIVLPQSWSIPTIGTPGFIVLTGLPYLAFKSDIHLVYPRE